jgi:hypothetical protein
MRRHAILLTVLCSCITIRRGLGVRTASEIAFDLAQTAEREGRTEEAIRAYEVAVNDLDSGDDQSIDPRARIALARLSLSIAPSRALACAQSAVDLEPELADEGARIQLAAKMALVAPGIGSSSSLCFVEDEFRFGQSYEQSSGIAPDIRGGGRVFVRSYARKDGTFVRSYTRRR